MKAANFFYKIETAVLIAIGFLAMSGPSASAVTGAVPGGYHIDSGGSVSINAHSVQKSVTNNHSSGLTIYVPLSTATEWATFVANPPGGVSVAAVCSGVTVGGYCWYLGALDVGCDTVCASHGGCNSAGTVNYSGSGGSTANCTAVLNALGKTGTAADNSTYNIGCALSSGKGPLRRYTLTTTCAAARNDIQRVCACNN